MSVSKPYRPAAFSIIIIFICLMIVGLALIPRLTIQLHPSASAHSLSVTYSWPDASAWVIEQEVTSKLEGVFNAVKGVGDISSVSSKGYGKIDLSFKKNSNRDAIRFELASLIRQLYPELPDGVSYPELSMGISGERAVPVMTYTIHASVSSYFIKKYAENNVLPALSKIKGVSEVRFYGATPYEIEIEFQVDRTQALSITGDDIARGINNYFRTELIGKGSYKQPRSNHITELSLHIQQSIADTVLWEKIPIGKVNERMIYLTDVAAVRYKEQTPSAYYRINGLNAISIVIYPEKGVNTINLADAIRKGMTVIRHHLPPGYAVLLASDNTQYLSAEIDKITFRAALSLLIVLLLILIVSREFRYVIIILVSIASNLLIAFIFFYLFQVDIQLYSIAGITVSICIVTGSSNIVLSNRKNAVEKRTSLAIGSSTVATIVALGVVFLLPEDQKLNLIDFTLVIIINLVVSLGVSIYFVPALMEKMKLKLRRDKLRKAAIRYTALYGKAILFSKKFKWFYIVLFVFCFGIPIHWLPAEIKGKGPWPTFYNSTLGNAYFRKDVRPLLEKLLGGSFRLFATTVFANSYYAEPAETMLHVRGRMPEGCTVQQMNETIQSMENFISKFDEIKLFQTVVWSYKNSEIVIQFKPEHELTGFPYFLKSELEAKASNLGGADWSIVGVGIGFSNALHAGGKSSRILLEGYNYDQLYKFAELLKHNLLDNPRIKEIDITGSEQWNATASDEFIVELDHEQLALGNVSIADFYSSMKDNGYRIEVHPVYMSRKMHRVYLTSDTYSSFNVWNFNNGPLKMNNSILKMDKFGTIEKRKTGNSITKYNQQYRLALVYDFIGSYDLSSLAQQQHIEAFKNVLPIGYTVKSGDFWGWNKNDRSQYFFVVLAVIAIYLTGVILLESILLPLAMIALIPFSFIGSFLTFYLFDINFDQGGFASFVLLSGLTASAALYILIDYNNFRAARTTRKPELALYLKSFNYMIIPIVFTTLSVALGLMPFMIQGKKEVFWYGFATGTIGGLLFSLIAIFVYLPLFLPLSNKKTSLACFNAGGSS